jgi:long-subunit acyl-CoA synthetase (AMP-forming)
LIHCTGGWFHTGDQGFLDNDGFLTLTGRIKELINRGGEKISPIEVRSQLCVQGAIKCGFVQGALWESVIKTAMPAYGRFLQLMGTAV